jgi:hypothetical protein
MNKKCYLYTYKIIYIYPATNPFKMAEVPATPESQAQPLLPLFTDDEWEKFSDLPQFTDDGWVHIMNELYFWNIVAHCNNIFGDTNFTLTQGTVGPILNINCPDGAIFIAPSINCTGIIVSIVKIFDDVVCGSIFIVNSMSEISVININTKPLTKRIIMAKVIDGDVFVNSVVYPIATKIYNAHADMFKSLLLQTP